MSCLGSYSLGSFMGVDEIPESVLNVLNESLRNEQSDKLKYMSEIITAGIRGSIDFNRRFDYKSFVGVIEKHKLMVRLRDKSLSIVQYSTSDECVIQPGTIREDCILDKVEDAYEELLNNDELYRAVESIKRLNNEYLVVEGVDLIEGVRLALKGIPSAIQSLQKICDFYPKIAEDIKVVLSSGVCFDEMFA